MGFFRTASRRISDAAQGFASSITRRTSADTCEQINSCINSPPARETLRGIKNGLIEGGLSGTGGGLGIGLTLTVMAGSTEPEAFPAFTLVTGWLMFEGLLLGVPVGASFNGFYGLCDGLSQKYFSKPLIPFNNAATDLAAGLVKGLGYAMGAYYSFFYLYPDTRLVEDALPLVIPMAVGGAVANTIYTSVVACRSRMFTQPAAQNAHEAEVKEAKGKGYQLMKDPVDLEIGIPAAPAPPI